mmetsp:Transcript_3696/g.6294  ORF Transcript_3696/g.6294 Transcript_3696/m.6294 type:complete len:252 (+) Transcript_3696:11-766(+)
MSEATKTEVKRSLLLFNLPSTTVQADLEAVLKANAINFSKVEMVDEEQFKKVSVSQMDSILKKQANQNEQSSSQAYAFVHFADRESMVKLAEMVVLQKSILVKNEVVKMKMHGKHGDFNEKTSVFLSCINPRCTEADLAKELTSLMKNEFASRSGEGLKRENMKRVGGSSGTRANSKSKQTPVNSDAKAGTSEKKYQLLSCVVLFDSENRRSRQFAFLDFNCEEAAQFCIKTWNNSSMSLYPNRIQASIFE